MRCLFIAFAASLLIANAGYGQTIDSPPTDATRLDSLRNAFRIPVPSRAIFQGLQVRSAPSMGAISPTAFGGSTGDAFVGATYATRARYVSEGDGVAAGGISLGSPRHAIGIDLVLNSYSTVRSGFLRTAGIDVQLNRDLPGDWGVAVGWENLIYWGDTQSNSPYGVISKWLQLKETDSEAFSALLMSIGLGSGRFQPEAQFVADRRGVNVFGSAAVRVLAPLAVVADWTGQDLTLLGSIAPFARIPIVFSAGFSDITGNAGDGARLTFSGGWGFNVLEWFR